MKTKEENRGKEEELSKKKELLSDEELLEVAAGASQQCTINCTEEGKSWQECQQRCKWHPY